MCIYAQTGNTALRIVSVLYLSLASIGCVLSAFAKDEHDLKNKEWMGWIPFSLALIISGIVVYFTIGSPIGVWYLCVCLYWYGIMLSSKQNNK
jgi:hypothetical protein